MGTNGRPTPESLAGVLGEISALYGGEPINAVYFADASYTEMVMFSMSLENKTADQGGYGVWSRDRNCGHFMTDALRAGGVDTSGVKGERPTTRSIGLGQAPGGEAMKGSFFQSVFRVEGRLDSMKLEEKLK